MKKIFLFAFILVNANLYSQFTDFHPEFNWYTIKGKNIEVHFHAEAERTARIVAKIAEEVWAPITSLYQYEPETVHYVIKDIDDYSNGAAFFFDNKIEIWTSALDFDLRGTHNWLRNVITHEFTHMVQIQASLKMSRRVPAFYLQWLNYEDERRPDILYGFPNFIMSYPIPGINMPAWFAEGTAQYMRPEFDYDNWDSHRDMILRSYVLDGNMLTWNQMGVFGKSSLGNESVYNSGFALTRYIAQKYGEPKLREITKALGNKFNFTIDAAFEDVLGKDGNQIYDEWKLFLTKSYSDRISEVKENLVVGDTIANIGFGNFYPTFSADGKKAIYLSNKTADYFGLTSLFILDLETKKEKLIVTGVRSTFSFISNTNKIIYAKLSDKNKNSYNIHDLYVYDIDLEKETRLTFGMRANSPNVSKSGDKIIFLFQRDGTANLGMVDIDGKNFLQLTFFQNGEQVYNPKFSNDDSFIVFDYSYHHTRDVAKIKTDGSGFEFIIQEGSDDRNPIIDFNGELIFSSDRTGIFNLYRKNLSSGKITQLSNVIGGAFMPSIDSVGNILYAGYTSTGYKIFKINAETQSRVIDGNDYVWLANPPLEQNNLNGDIQNFNIKELRFFNDKEVPNVAKQEYDGVFTKMSFFPFLRFDNYNTSNKVLDKMKPGLYLTSSDILNRYSLFAGASINARLERDLFFMFEYKEKLPILFSLGLKPDLALEIFNISRKADVDILIEEFSPIQTDVTYSLFEVALSAKHRLFSRNHNIEFRYSYSSYTATLGSFVFPGTTSLYPAFSDKYFIGNNFQIKYDYQFQYPYKHSEINPIQTAVELKYNHELNKYNPDGSYSYEEGILVPEYKDYSLHRFELNTKYGFQTFDNHSLTTRLRAGTILGPTVPDFFDFYVAGLIGIKAYPFYSMSGNEALWLNLTYRFPLITNIDARFGHLYLDKIFLSVFGDVANAWNGKEVKLNQFKRGAGAELRFALNSFYLFPTSVFVNASYGFDKFDRTTRRDEVVSYGGEWKFYGGILFGFDI